MATAVWDNLGSTTVLSGGNLTATAPSGGADGNCRATGNCSGKTYIEYTLSNVTGQRPTPGLANVLETNTNSVNSIAWNPAFGVFINSVDQCPGFGGGVSGDILGIATDMTVTPARAYFRKNGGSWFPSGADPVAGTGGVDISSLGVVYGYAFMANASNVLTANFGGSAYAAAAPTGYGPVGGDTPKPQAVM